MKWRDVSTIKMPLSLYKFRYFDPDGYNLRILTHNELFLSSPSNFNDPFDSFIPVKYEGTNEEMEDFCRDHILEQHPNWKENDVKTEVRKMVKNIRTPDWASKGRKREREFINKNYGVFSMTTDYKNILMWSHYSHSHTGFCVGLNYRKLELRLKNFDISTESLLYIFPIEYSKAYPLVNRFKHDNIERFKKTLLVKAENWRYENEYRLIGLRFANSKIDVGSGIINRVILGCQISSENRKRIVSILENRQERIYLYETSKKENDFGLDFNRINY